MLMRRWERARQGDGQLVLIVGEPGLGKSRLIEEFHARLRDTPHTWVEWSCSQLLQNTPLHPIAEWGRQRFGGADVPAERRLADLESTLALIKLDPAENVPCSRRSSTYRSHGTQVTLAPEELRRRQLAALTNWAMAGAKVQPVVLAFEDVHWADPTTLDVFRGIAERGALAPLFSWRQRARNSGRPGACARITARSRSRRLTAPRCATWWRNFRPPCTAAGSRRGCRSAHRRRAAVRRGSDRLLLERGEQGGIQAIPPTLQQSLTARLDRLGPAREVAQIGCGHRPRFLLPARSRRCRNGGRAAADGAGTAR